MIPEKDLTWKAGYNNCEAVGKILAGEVFIDFGGGRCVVF